VNFRFGPAKHIFFSSLPMVTTVVSRMDQPAQSCLTSHADRERFALWTSARKVLPLLGGKEIQSQSFSDLHFAVIGETARIGVRLSFSPLFGV